MFIVVGTKQEYVTKPRGMRLSKSCPECRRTTTFFEVVPREYITIFWMPVIPTGSGDAVLECEGCHKHFQVGPEDRSPPPAPTVVRESGDRITVTCPKCAARARVPFVTETLRVTCPACREKFDV